SAEDVERAAAGPAPVPAGAPATATTTVPAPTGEVERVPLTPIRRTIARRLTEAWQAPVFQIAMSADMTRAQGLHDRLAEQTKEGEPRPTVTDILTKACATALMRHRAVNALWAEDAIELHPSANVGIAVAIDAGLVVPVIHQAERRARRCPRRYRHARARQQVASGRPRRRHVHDLEPRHVRRRAVRRRSQPAAGGDSRGRRDRAQGRADRDRVRSPPADVGDADV